MRWDDCCGRQGRFTCGVRTRFEKLIRVPRSICGLNHYYILQVYAGIGIAHEHFSL